LSNYAAGLTVATIGAEHQNFDLIIAGSIIQQMSGLVFAMSYATSGTVSNLDSIVSRWGRSGLQSGDWVMKGRASRLNYFLSGKWQPGWKVLGSNRYAPFDIGEEFLVGSGNLKWPSGVTGFLKGLLGQRMYVP
jgi:hypothetical protein